MNKKNVLVSILGFIAIFMIILGIFIFIKNKKVNTNVINTNIVRDVTNRNVFYDVKSALNTFYLGCVNINNNSEEAFINKDEIFNLLDEEYINWSGLKSSDIDKIIENFKFKDYIIKDMVFIHKEKSISLYYIKIEFLSDNLNNDNYEFLIKLDEEKLCFSIYLQDYVENLGYNNLEYGEEIKINLLAIKKYNYNGYTNNTVDNRTLGTDIFNQFKSLLLNYRKISFEYLDEDYKMNNYKNYDEFNNYTKENIVKFVSMKIENLEVLNYSDNTKFIVKTNEGFEFTIIAYSPMDYTVVINEE